VDDKIAIAESFMRDVSRYEVHSERSRLVSAGRRDVDECNVSAGEACA
jgi:hypothetical protein